MAKKIFKLLVINPGSTSTKLSLFTNGKESWRKDLEVPKEELKLDLKAQHPFRLKAVENALTEAGINLNELSAIVSRGAPLRPLKGGTYLINDRMLDDLSNLRLQAPHISYVGGVIARELADRVKIPALTADPISVDEFHPLARYSGHPEIPRKSLWHALNCRRIARKTGDKLGRDWKSLNLIVAHLGGGISVVAFLKGRVVDSGNASSEGPFSPERTGSLPVVELLEWLKAKNLSYDEGIKVLTRQGGLTAYSGSSSAREIETRIRQGDKKAKEVYLAMAYQIAKQIASLSIILNGKIDRIVLTGGLAKSKMLTARIKSQVKFLAPVLILPGEEEMIALAEAALRVLQKKEKPLTY